MLMMEHTQARMSLAQLTNTTNWLQMQKIIIEYTPHRFLPTYPAQILSRFSEQLGWQVPKFQIFNMINFPYSQLKLLLICSTIYLIYSDTEQTHRMLMAEDELGTHNLRSVSEHGQMVGDTAKLIKRPPCVYRSNHCAYYQGYQTN